MTNIISAHAYRRFDSRGNPTIQAVIKAGDIEASALVPSGASTGIHEALELRDSDNDFGGKDVKKAIENVSKISDAIKGINVMNQKEVDQIMIDLDGTENKSNLGANAILAVSLAVARAASKAKDLELFEYIAETFSFETKSLPTPMMNVLNGGAHTNWESTDFQEFMIVPHGASTFSEKMKWGVETYHSLKSLLKEKGYPTLVGDEGGFAPKFKSNEEAIETVLAAIEKAGFDKDTQISIAIDPAVSEIYDAESSLYNIKTENKKLTSEAIIELWESWISQYPIISIEDGLAQDDWDGWKNMTAKLGEKIQIVGDDFLVTNTRRVEKAINEKSANALLVKLNQIGTLTETVDAIKMCHEAGWNTIISHRSGETEDTFIADLAVATGSNQIKTGSPARGERVAKYNRLLDIEERFLNR